jgi:hypothetical protein
MRVARIRPLVIAFLLLALPASAFAQAVDTTVVDKMKELNKQAVSDYQGGDFESAKLGLLEAIAIGTKAGLSSHPMMARTYVNLGAVYVNGYKDRSKGGKALSTALKIKSDITLTEGTITPELREAFAGLQGEAKGAAPPPPPPKPPADAMAKKPDPFSGEPSKPKEESQPQAPAPPPPEKRDPDAPEEPDLPASIPQPLYCPNADEAPPSERIALRCVAQPGLRASRVMLYFRVPGGEKFTPVRTKRSPKGWYNGVIPAEAVVGKSLQYYFEARDASDQVSSSAGRSDSPNLILIREGAPVVGEGALAMLRFQRQEGEPAPEENPLAAVELAKARERLASGLHRRKAGAFFLGVGAGSGWGWHPKEYLEFYDDHTIQAGPLPSGFMHLLPEIGYQVSEHFAVSGQARIQLISQTGSGDKKLGNPATGAFVAMLRAQYLAGDGNAQFTLSAFAGAGEGFRLTVAPQGKDMLRNDSVRGGPLVVGPGLGFIYHLQTYMAFVIDTKGLVGYPTFALVGDLSAGLQFSF